MARNAVNDIVNFSNEELEQAVIYLRMREAVHAFSNTLQSILSEHGSNGYGHFEVSWQRGKVHIGKLSNYSKPVEE